MLTITVICHGGFQLFILEKSSYRYLNCKDIKFKRKRWLEIEREREGGGEGEKIARKIGKRK